LFRKRPQIRREANENVDRCLPVQMNTHGASRRLRPKLMGHHMVAARHFAQDQKFINGVLTAMRQPGSWAYIQCAAQRTSPAGKF
jgi:hypothetical protein